MLLKTGQTIIHPFHGPATVTGVSTRMLRGCPTEYAELLIEEPREMTISVPVEKAAEIGLRAVAGTSELDNLAEVFCAPSGKQEKSWARRMKAHGIKLQTGEQLLIAEVARDLIRRRQERDISLAEKEMLADALRPLVAEVAIAVDVPEEDAEAVITELVPAERSQ